MLNQHQKLDNPQPKKNCIIRVDNVEIILPEEFKSAPSVSITATAEGMKAVHIGNYPTPLTYPIGTKITYDKLKKFVDEVVAWMKQSQDVYLGQVSNSSQVSSSAGVLQKLNESKPMSAIEPVAPAPAAESKAKSSGGINEARISIRDEFTSSLVTSGSSSNIKSSSSNSIFAEFSDLGSKREKDGSIKSITAGFGNLDFSKPGALERLNRMQSFNPKLR